MVRLSTAWAIFQGLLVEALPFLLIGVAISGIARWLVPQAAWIRRIPRNPVLAPIIGALLGFALPACECVPVHEVWKRLDCSPVNREWDQWHPIRGGPTSLLYSYEIELLPI